MKPQNEKSLFHFLLDVMDKVAQDEISAEKAHSICEVSKEAEKLLKGERERVKLLMQLDIHEKEYGKRPDLRELASLGFSDTTKDPSTGVPRLESDLDYTTMRRTR